MKRSLAILLVLALCLILVRLPRSKAFSTYYASPSGSGTTCSFASPCALQAGLDKVTAGDTLYLRAGTYTGKFTASVSGSVSSRITVQPYTGEVAIIDGYFYTTLNGAINSSTQTIVLTDGSGFIAGQDITIADGSPGSEEIIHLGTKSVNTFTSSQRGWSGTTATSHSSGAQAILSGNQLYVTGSYWTFRDLEIMNSNTTREQTPANSQNGPRGRGIGIFNVGSHNEFINNSLHDNENGYFNGSQGVGPLVYGNLIYNNGYIAAGAAHGHGLYLIHSDVTDTAYIKDNIIWNNCNHGIKGDSQNGNTVNIWSEGNVSFNTSPWTGSSARGFNLLMASNNGISTQITAKDNFLFHIAGINATNLQLGLGGAANGSATVTGNQIANGIPISIQYWNPLTLNTNKVSATTNTGGGNSTVILYQPTGSPTPTVTWNSNTFWNTITSGRGYFYPGASTGTSTFALWKVATGFDASSTETQSTPAANWVTVRANVYQTGRGHIIIYNFLGSTSVSVDISSLGLVIGQAATIYAAEDRSTPVATITSYDGNPVSIPVNGTTVTQPIGWGTTITTTRPAFQAFVVVPGAQSQGSAPSPPTSLAATWSFSSQGAIGNVALSWVNPTSGAAIIVDKSSDGSTWTNVTTTSADATSYAVTGLANSGLWYFRVRASKSGLESANVGPVTEYATKVSCYKNPCTR